MKSKKSFQPTESELEILQILWEKSSATVREVHDILAKSRDIGYTTTLKTMQIMTDKGLLQRDTSSRSHLYLPAIGREQTQKQFIGKMVDSLFSGSSGGLVLGALDHKKLSREEISQIRDYLKQMEE